LKTTGRCFNIAWWLHVGGSEEEPLLFLGDFEEEPKEFLFVFCSYLWIVAQRYHSFLFWGCQWSCSHGQWLCDIYVISCSSDNVMLLFLLFSYTNVETLHATIFNGQEIQEDECRRDYLEQNLQEISSNNWSPRNHHKSQSKNSSHQQMMNWSRDIIPIGVLMTA